MELSNWGKSIENEYVTFLRVRNFMQNQNYDRGRITNIDRKSRCKIFIEKGNMPTKVE